MAAFLSEYEPILRFSFFLGLLTAMGLWETVAARRTLNHGRWRRWATNIGLSVLNSLVLRLALPVLAVGAAVWAQETGTGLFNRLALPDLLASVLCFLALDLLIYGQHALFHHVPFFWRLHRVHHADPDFDVTTGIRFHPIEILLSMGIKLAFVVALGISPAVVIVFEIVLNATSLFNHGNVRLPDKLDRALRQIMVTPDMHRVHHSVIRSETDSNFGFNLSIWDRIFGTYCAQPLHGHIGMEIGLPEYRGEAPTHLGWSLMNPFRRGNAKEHT